MTQGETTYGQLDGTKDRDDLQVRLVALLRAILENEKQWYWLGVQHAGVREAVFDHGREFTPIPRPSNFRKMTQSACFANARLAVMRRALKGQRYLYGEGFAETEHGWMHHGWVVDSEDNAIEVTWSQPALRYIGVTFEAKDAVRGMSSGRPCGSIFFDLADEPQ